MNKKYILALIVIIIAIVAIGAGIFLSGSSCTVDVYIDGENATASIESNKDVDKAKINKEICDYTLKSMDRPNIDADTLKEGIKDICSKHGFITTDVNLDSSLGKNSIPVFFIVDGTSMVPTLQDGQDVLVNKTQNVHVGDIVVADSSVYGNIIKRVDQVNDNQIHLVSDNKNVEYTEINGAIYETKGISTWVDSSDIYGVVIKY